MVRIMEGLNGITRAFVSLDSAQVAKDLVNKVVEPENLWTQEDARMRHHIEKRGNK